MPDTRVFGPVPSRRLGRSLGINNIPPKICTYSCVYCQLGRSIDMTSTRKVFYDPDELGEVVADHIQRLPDKEDQIDFLTIVPDGEPTLDINLGNLIENLRSLGIKIAVITNATLLHDPEVQMNLKQVDLVSLKVDCVDLSVWKKIDRPYGKLDRKKILSGIKSFTAEYQGKIITETMLVKDLNDQPDIVQRTAEYLGSINLDRAYLSIPTRPPAEKWVMAPTEDSINTAFQIYQQAGLSVEYLIGYEGNEFSSTGDIKNDLLSITAVHPMREEAVVNFIQRAGGDLDIVENMLQDGSLVTSDYQDKRYFLRKLH